MATQHSRHSEATRETAAPRAAAAALPDGPAAYPYEPGLRLEEQQGLDRLRCIADRALAANYFELFRAAERNTAAAHSTSTQAESQFQRLRGLAARALDGEFGDKPKELADCLLVDERGVRSTDERTLREFAVALNELRRLAG